MPLVEVELKTSINPNYSIILIAKFIYHYCNLSVLLKPIITAIINVVSKLESKPKWLVLILVERNKDVGRVLH